jgi:hypothetical protein
MGFQTFETVKTASGHFEIISNTYTNDAVGIHIDGVIDIRLSITATQARALAAQLIAAADHAEGV